MRTAEHKPIGASLIEEAAVRQIDATHDVVNAKPGVKALKYDVFLPMGAGNLPIVVITAVANTLR